MKLLQHQLMVEQINNITMKSIIILILSGVVACFNGQDTANIEFINLNKSYKSSDKIEFEIKNHFSDTVFYFIGLESYMDENWRETINDISRPLSKSSKILKLASGEENKVVHQFKDLPDDYFDRFVKFRFVVNYGFSVNKIKQKTYSDSFEITND
jgi:hypothetical protein